MYRDIIIESMVIWYIISNAFSVTLSAAYVVCDDKWLCVIHWSIFNRVVKNAHLKQVQNIWVSQWIVLENNSFKNTN